MDLEINIEIDELTDCLIDRETHEKYDTECKLISTSITSSFAKELKKNGWSFDWSIPQKDGYEVYSLNIVEDDEIQGLIALKHITKDLYTHVALVESNPMNRDHEKGKYIGTGGNLFAFACKLSFDVGNEGFVQFTAKTSLINHYKTTLGAKQIDGQRMYIDTDAALELVNRYFSEEV
ncbi:MAG: hypothetical protein IJ661_10155 [Lachnospiraceae bacterium]|nr:hypothetical protein [Lachnospiraceae bacterium]